MPYQYPEIRRFAGLHKQQNSFTVPDGACEEIENFVIVKDDIPAKRRGFYQFLGTSDTLNNLAVYQDNLMAILSDKAAYLTETGSSPNITGVQNDLTGKTVSLTAGRIARAAESNGNLYFTSDNGVMKLDAYDGKVFNAGVPPALDLRARFLAESGVISGDGQVAWRVIYGRRDDNDNLLLSAPSEIVVLTNPKTLTNSWTRASNVVTVTSPGHGLAVGMSISVSGSSGGSPDVVDGTYLLTAVTLTTFSFAETAANSSGTLDWSAARKPRLEFSIPSEIDDATDGYFAQVYRSTQTSADSVSPSSDFKLATEIELTAADITAGFVTYDDVIDDILLGAELYTNPNSREGELQANDRAPLCEDVTVFKNHLFHGNCQTRHSLDLQVIDTTNLGLDSEIVVKVGAVERTYKGRIGVGNSTVAAEGIAGSGTLTITYTAHGLQSGDFIYADVLAGTFTSGEYAISNVTANTFDIVGAGTATSIDFQGVRNSAGEALWQVDNTSSSISVQLRRTAQGIVKAINRDGSSLVYSRYTSGIAGTPGQLNIQAVGFTAGIYLRAGTTAVGSSFSPNLPTSFASGTQVFSRNDQQPHMLYISKIDEPEAVPLVNFLPVGSKNAEIKRIHALRDSLIILKEDGVYRLTGDTVGTFVVTALDDTVHIVAKSSSDVLNNQVIFLSNQGFCLVTDASVQIISRVIEDVIQPIIGNSNIEAQTFGVAYETERLYIVSTLEPNTNAASATYCYNILNGIWTTWDFQHSSGVVGPNDKLYTIDTGLQTLQRERKDHTLVDYCGQNFTITVDSVESDLLSAIITSTAAAPEAGDAIIKSDRFNKIAAVESLGGNQYSIDFDVDTNLVATDSLQLYDAYKSTLKLAPYHAGLVGRNKQYSQMQMHMRNNAASKLSISFSGNFFGNTAVVNWENPTLETNTGGWGNEPWGFFPWGNEDTINLQFGTQPAPIARVYVPRFQQRTTFIQPLIEHNVAGEPISIQAISFAVRAYGERVTT